MEFARRRLFYRKEDLQLAWEGLPSNSGFFASMRHVHAPREALTEAGHFLGGSLLDHGFKIFKNGGLPLIERRTGPLIEEIVLRSSPYVCDEPFLPIRVYLHLSHTRLQDVRLRYWRPPSRAPSGLACLDLGQLELPPCWVVWNVGLDYEVLVELVDWVRRLALPWFDLFENPEMLKQALYQRMVTGLDLDRSLELILAEFGPIEGIRFINECILKDDFVASRITDAAHSIQTAAASGHFGADPIWNIATIASAYSLI
jgi:hypothetical protein